MFLCVNNVTDKIKGKNDILRSNSMKSSNFLFVCVVISSNEMLCIMRADNVSIQEIDIQYVISNENIIQDVFDSQTAVTNDEKGVHCQFSLLEWQSHFPANELVSETPWVTSIALAGIPEHKKAYIKG